MPDFVASFDGSLWLVEPQNAAAREHLAEHVEDDAQWFGGRLVVEHRYIGSLVEGLANEGYRVRVL